MHFWMHFRLILCWGSFFLNIRKTLNPLWIKRFLCGGISRARTYDLHDVKGIGNRWKIRVFYTFKHSVDRGSERVKPLFLLLWINDNWAFGRWKGCFAYDFWTFTINKLPSIYNMIALTHRITRKIPLLLYASSWFEWKILLYHYFEICQITKSEKQEKIVIFFWKLINKQS